MQILVQVAYNSPRSLQQPPDFPNFAPFKNHCDSHLRRELVSEPLVMENGVIPLPDKPGLGIELNRDALERYAWKP